MKLKPGLNFAFIVCLALSLTLPLSIQAEGFRESIFDPGPLKPRDSQLKVKAGDPVPLFTLPSVNHGSISITDFRERKNVVLSFIPAAWTPVCSDQWPGYNIVEELFKKYDTELLGITTDNIPSLYSWTKQMGDLWFPVLSDFWPHGEVAEAFGLLRGDGTSERALVVIDKKGVIRYINVSDINIRPPLDELIKELRKLP